MKREDKVLAINALLGLTNTIVRAGTEAKRIETHADISREELAWKIEGTKKQNELELKKVALEMQLKENARLQDDLDNLNANYLRVTNTNYSPVDETVEGNKLTEKHYSDGRITIESLLEDGKNKETELRNEKANISQDIGKINKLIAYTKKGYVDLDGDGKLDEADYHLFLEQARKDLNIDIDQEKYANVLEQERLNVHKIGDINWRLRERKNKEKKDKLSDDLVIGEYKKDTMKFVSSMGVLIAASEDGSELPTWTLIKDDLEKARKSKQPFFGEMIDSKEKQDLMEQQIINTLSISRYDVYKKVLKEVKWFEPMVKKYFTFLQAQFIDSEKDLLNVMYKKPIDKKNKEVKTDTFDMDAFEDSIKDIFNDE